MREAVIERLEGDFADVTTTQPAARGKRLVLQCTTGTGELIIKAAEVTSCTTSPCESGMRWMLTLSLTTAALDRQSARQRCMEGCLIVGAVLVTETSVHVRHISATGAELETAIHLPIGTIGMIEVEFDGDGRLEWFRVCRIHTTQACSGAHLAAAEFLAIAAVDQHSLRGAVRRFIARDAHLLIP